MTLVLEKRTARHSPKPVVKSDAKRNADAALREQLIYEMENGKPVYYRGYKEVLDQKLPPEAIMGSGFQQSSIVALLVAYLLPRLPKHHLLTNEFGILYEKANWKAADIAIYAKEQLKGIPFEDKHLAIPPKVIIEVDTKADMEHFGSFTSYCFRKTEALLGFGVEKVIWVLTKDEKILQAEPKKDWILSTWKSKIPVAGKVSFVLDTLLKNR
jgi:hypothetical protein